MSLLVDPRICPDCRALLDATATCTRCGLRLAGPAAAELWSHMQQADRLIAELRTAAPRAATPSATPPSSASHPTNQPQTARKLPGASVPVVLLTLGGLCLLVAAIVFVAVAWSSLGLAAKTLILLAVTALLGAAAVVVTRRRLRVAAETLWLVVAGMVALDLAAAYGGDLVGLGRLDDRAAVALVGAALLALAVGVNSWVGTTALDRVHGLVPVAGLGTALLVGAEAWLSDHNPAAVAVSVPLLVAVGWAVDRATDGHLRTTAVVVGSAAPVSWLVLVGHGLDRMATTGSDREWWSELTGWPLLVAAVLAAAPALVGSLPVWSRRVSAAAALVTSALFAVGPATGPTADLLALAGVSLVLALVAAVGPPTWARPAAALAVFTLVTWTLAVLFRPLEVIGHLPSTAPSDAWELGLLLPSRTGPAGWTSVVSVVVVGTLGAALLRHLADTTGAAVRVWIGLAPGVLALGTTTWLLEERPALAVAVAAWAATALLASEMVAVVRHHDAALAAGLVFVAYLLGMGLRLTAPSHLLAALLGTVAALVAALAYARAARNLLRGALVPILGAAVVAAAGFAATHWPYLAGGRADAASLGLAVVAGLGLVAAGPVGRDETSRRAVELTSLAIGLLSTVLSDDGTTVATALTIVGSAVAFVAILNRDREAAAWLAVVLLGGATGARVIEDVRAPEAYTLPAAALLVMAGWWRLRTDERAGSMRVMGPGVALGLAPSVLLALDEPVSLRGALVAAAGIAFLAFGIVQRWSAPFLAGAVTTGVLALRHLGPVADALPRWISLGVVGLALLVVGVSWEQRQRDLRAAARYLGALR